MGILVDVSCACRPRACSFTSISSLHSLLNFLMGTNILHDKTPTYFVVEFLQTTTKQAKESTNSASAILEILDKLGNLSVGSLHASEKLKYRRRVIGKQRAKVSGCTIFRTRVIRQRVSLKIIVFSLETPCWSSSEGLQHGRRKPFETSGVYFGFLKTFLLSVELKNIRLGTSLDILVTQN